ncbi:mitotic chromosome condensation-related protein [Moesziomyces antarcticus]|uniref:Related to YCS4 - subunit of condensin protein complex n=2 Tax=Pseudozyma antarctica TaxID=84753 RepID=A0A5C3FN76_PSEA2|nr:mitotic chromosome condensation-related protein [Moesziomyces antarcticus]GAK64550.1 mitotic chromosome condensation-related protein [Moesziomyces antarcticus]SPO44941.1 related to YCS4 - subunit of condensin protein complex [Moesziomyces antarcticus]
MTTLDGAGDASGSSYTLADEILLLQDEPYIIPQEVAVDDMNPSEQISTLDTAIDAITSSPDNVSNPEIYDLIRSYLKHFPNLCPNACNKLLDVIASGMSNALDEAQRELDGEDPNAYASHAETLERFAFLLQWLVSVAEKHSGARSDNASSAAAITAARGGRRGTGSKSAAAAAAAKSGSGKADAWAWSNSIPAVLALMSKAARVRSERMWTVSAARDAFVSGCLLRPALLLQENESYLKVQPIKLGIFKVICQAVKAHGQAFSAQTSIMQSLQYYEHLAEPMAELLAVMRLEFDYERLGEEVLREVAAKSFGAMDTKSPRSFGRFLVRMAELSPRSVLKQISLLQKHLDSESYPMRNALIETLGLLIKELALTDDSLNADGAANGAGTDEGADENRGTAEARKKQIETFFDLLIERFLDLNSYVRSKLITVCARLLDLPTKFPKQRTEITNMVIRHLEDKSSGVRKNAIALLTKLILTHPFGMLHGGELSLQEWQARFDLVSKELEETEGSLNLPGEDTVDQDADSEDEDEDEEEDDDEDMDEDGDETVTNDDEDEEEDDEDAPPRRKSASKSKSKSTKPKAKKGRRSGVDMQALAAAQAEMEPVDAEKVMRLRLTKRYYTDAIAFITQIETAMPNLTLLLASTNKAEVLESMEFFRVAYEYKLSGAAAGVRKMVHLIWTKDNALVMEDGSQLKGVRSRLIEVYRALYFDARADMNAKDNVARIAKNMIERTFGATLAELTSLEEMLKTMQIENLVHPEVVNKLWAVYSAPRAISAAQRRGAIIVLGMLATARREIISEQIDVLLRVGLGPLGARDVVLAKYTCVALQRLGGSVKKVKGALSDESVRYPMSHPLFGRLRAAIQMSGDVLKGESKAEWFSLAENAINTVYLLGEQPDAMCTEIICSMTSRVFGGKPAVRAASPSSAMDEDRDDAGSDVSMADARESLSGADAPVTGDAFQLAQLLFVVGHVALKHIVYLELVEREYKRRKTEADKEKAVAKAVSEGKASKAAAAAAAAAVEELDQVAGNAEDEIGEVIASVREKELLYGNRSVLAMFGPIVTHVCSSPKSYPNELVRRAAVLTLCKFMCVSSTFCEANLALLLLLTKSKDAVIRSNVVIALGDIAVCFGSLVDENSDRLYAGLGDPDLSVKKHTLMVLTHLILNGMIKVKGQLGEMAKCLEDPEPRVSDLAKLFFSELATKENAVYNNLPDIISHLSIGKHAVDEETFARTMKFIFTFIDKEKQAENVVEKLCQRFRMASEERQWRDIAFCLSLLPYKSERSIKKLIDGLPFYQDKLFQPEVYKRFQEILAKARANKTAGGAGAGRGAGGAAAGGAAGEGAGDLREFEEILAQAAAKGEQDEALEGAAQAKVAKLTRGKGRGKTSSAAATGAAKRATRASRRISVASEA